jgi:hypothetical protein
MATYRIYYCMKDDKRFGVNDFDAPDDTGAIERARRQGTLLNVPIFEIWQGDSLVYREDRTQGVSRQFPSACPADRPGPSTAGTRSG